MSIWRPHDQPGALERWMERMDQKQYDLAAILSAAGGDAIDETGETDEEEPE